ncbi:Clavaminate synthase-like protein [Gymnopilus junonius]|uniref:Clavaminate synthase-like protein n=1 Tax=Gymnopilus junonius TaxID=109634 RepID=A0A9P5TFK3_GYMJU|nr:Clavaminate synthase-like protein [Gymnopilus junonius]
MSIPMWPEDVPTHSLLVIDYELLKKRDVGEIERLWEAATKLGFWYLKNHEVDELAQEMFDLGAEVMALPHEEKMKFEQGDDGESFGYKKAGGNAVAASGEPDTAEFLNIAKDDALAWPNLVRRAPPGTAYPAPALARMESTVKPFIEKSLAVNNTLMDILNDKLGLKKGRLLEFYTNEEFSGSEARIIRNPPMSDTQKIALGSHTDFGSLSFLHNRQGGLQVLPPGSETWQYVEPIANHAICNVGDSLAIFSGGILRSNLHRVIPPPSTQANTVRWSLVFFSRPGNSSVLRALVEGSDKIANAVASSKEGEDGKKFDTGSTAEEWFARRIKNQRIANRKGPETWMASRGTERVQVA